MQKYQRWQPRTPRIQMPVEVQQRFDDLVRWQDAPLGDHHTFPWHLRRIQIGGDEFYVGWVDDDEYQDFEAWPCALIDENA